MTGAGLLASILRPWVSSHRRLPVWGIVVAAGALVVGLAFPPAAFGAVPASPPRLFDGRIRTGLGGSYILVGP